MDNALANSNTQEFKNDVEMIEDEEASESGIVKNNDSKKAKTKNGDAINTGSAASSSSGTSNSLSLNLPIPGSSGKAAILNSYDPEISFSLNDTFEFIGIVSLDPSLASFPTDASMFHLGLAPDHFANSLPSSQVPRIHVLKQQKIVHSNPLLPMELSQANYNLDEASQCSAKLHAILTKALMGDSLAADYLICHLVARIYSRQDVLTLGKFSLNLIGVPLVENYTKKLTALLQLLMSKSHYLALNVENFNKSSFLPKKDNHENRLISGLLQLSKGTHLILDETQMTNGELNPEGLRNLTALGNLIRWQKGEYNFSYHQLEYPKDIPCLTMSEGRSLLPQDAQLLLNPTNPITPESINEQFEAIESDLNVQLLEKLRKFLTVMRNHPLEIPDDIQNFVQVEYVIERHNNPGAQRMIDDDLNSCLVLAKLVALGRGMTQLDKESWNKVKSMETERKERMTHLPARARPNGPVAANVV